MYPAHKEQRTYPEVINMKTVLMPLSENTENILNTLNFEYVVNRPQRRVRVILNGYAPKVFEKMFADERKALESSKFCVSKDGVRL